jgi:hypothetical protein
MIFAILGVASRADGQRSRSIPSSCLSVTNSWSRGDRAFEQAPAVSLPTVVIRLSGARRRELTDARFGESSVAMRASR